MKILRTYLKEHLGAIVLYLCFILVFLVVFILYNVRLDAVQYAFFLSCVLLILYGTFDFLKFRKHHLELKEIENTVTSDLSRLPEALDVIEKDYQRILGILYEEKVNLESDGRIKRQDMLDYYSMWAHQIKTPISAMHVLLQAKEQQPFVGEGEIEAEQGLMREIKTELFKIEQYVEMVLTYLRVEDMSGDLAFEIYSLDDIIRQAVRKYSRMFILKKIKLNYETVDQKVLTDDKWLVFVLEQVLSNALKYTRSGEISVYMKENALVIEDTGIGIWKEDLPRVFEKGFTGYNGRNDKKSTGIGLYLCKTIMDKLKHGIRIESEVGKGTKVYLYLNRKQLRVE